MNKASILLSKTNEAILLKTCQIIQDEVDDLMKEYLKTRHKGFNFIEEALYTIRTLIETRNRLKNHFNLD